jgi:autotransporter passenger strand-loop-strand repeat protein
LEIVASGGTVIAATIAGGIMNVSASGLAKDTLVGSSGGVTGDMYVFSGGTASGTIVANDSVALVLSGGTLANATLLGGTVEVQSGGIGSGTVTFEGSGTLILDGYATPESDLSIHFNAKIQGLWSQEEAIDLKDLAFTPGFMLASFSGGDGTGTLTVSNLVTHQHVILSLLGNYQHSTFNTAADSASGTLVFDPPADSAGEPWLAQPGRGS